MQIFLIIVSALLFVGFIGYFIIKKKVSDFSKEFFGTSDIKKAIQDLEIEAQETPKSLSGMETLMLPILKEDFPQLNINEMKSIVENKIYEIFEAIKQKDLNHYFESEKISIWVKDKIEKNIKYSSLKIHRTILNKYEKKDNIATLSFKTALEYIREDKKGLTKKIQTRLETEFIYIIDSSKASEKQKNLTLNCPNCGAPIKKLQEKYCVYCNCGILDIVKKVWAFNNIREF